MIKIMAVLLLSVAFPISAFAQFSTSTEDLLEKAEKRGEIRVIVKLKKDTILNKALQSINSEEELRYARIAVSSAVNRLRNSQKINLLIQSGNIKSITPYDILPFFDAVVDVQGLKGLLNHPAIEHIRQSRTLRPTLNKTVPLITNNTNPWKNFKDKKGALLGGKDTIVAVLDTGIDRDHPMVKGKVLREACFVTDASCPYGLDRAYGKNMAKDKLKWGSSYKGHGMHVTGIAAGSYVDRKLFVDFGGVAHEAKIVFARVFNKNGEGDDRSIINALSWVYTLVVAQKLNIASVNLSFSDNEISTPSACDEYNTEDYSSIVSLLKSKGVAVIASSGNSSELNKIEFPACLSDVISVGNSTDNDAIWASSNSASFLDFVAPGTRIYSAYDHPKDPLMRYGNKTGTSMAAPHVAGAWAVMKQLYPNGSVGAIKAALQSTGKIIRDGRAGQTWLFVPRLNLGEAINNYGKTTGHTYAAFGNGWDFRFERGGFPWIAQNSDGSVNGVLKNYGKQDQWNKLALRKNFRDGTVKVRIKRVSNAYTGQNDDNSNNILLRCSGALSTVEPCLNGYMFQYTNSGFVSVWTIKDGIATSLLSWTGNFAHLINKGDYNTLWVRATGSKLEFGINKTMAWVGYNTDHKEGQNGVSYFRNATSSELNTVFVDSYFQLNNGSIAMGQDEEFDMTQYIFQEETMQTTEDSFGGSPTGFYH